MLVIPAIDIRGGKCVRLFRGDFSKETVFSDSPAQMAKKWMDMGARYLHLVDLDGALAGKPQNIATVKDIIAAVDIPVELGGGIRTLEDIENILSIGVDRVILGSVAVHDPQLVKAACEKFGEKIVVGIDAKEGIVAVEGWEVSGNMAAQELAKRMAAVGVKNIIYTDISRDGTLLGLNIKATADLAKSSRVNIIASGGFSNLEEIEQLKKHESDGITGVIAGKAIYTGAIDLRAALKIAEKK
ncbi:1-(5-phosphoribosyl)-5-[(5-phosphoribosylamino)methylideneamino]imidazole-4-carboxamide isomerase [Pectinatus brassicae]|uniref:1-(5-phosphoribosyl)-5-[(5-phosphoribosylamino)methylideneamino] imidazole-4-carboxamide isomerase n=1 Tax=Pectinatus brassicae TaxID=862415 RepID=A0A840UGS4_9FIRM|nr:1-(5-phosphoribosyl)-5-[(5-phosphoribosylamino)methylideneamino]imidazole-4-carboxamide isomerase [Pectinatus brassicae]MBB5336326.1 phosphoribosylformimino-5-aminoimidazole carboxamide ribotide isomerase [Pectinatus brassicae]